jgi:glyoxylase-like metal-dependent hydrolase (beta-lactamase superfamily II)
VRVVSLHPDVLLATSAIWQANCVLVRATGGEGGSGAGSAHAGGAVQVIAGSDRAGIGGRAGETFVIDSPILPDELDALPALVEQSGFPAPSGLLATHGDWDHLLGRLAFPALALGCSESTAARMRASPGEAQRELREFDQAHFIERERPLALGAMQALPVPGSCGIAERELELHPACGHTGDGMAIAIPWAGVLLAGDYLSPLELPVFGPAGAADAYLDTLARLRPLVARAQHVVPGHGPVLDPERALAILDEDLLDVEASRPSSSTRLRRSSRSARPPRSARPR